MRKVLLARCMVGFLGMPFTATAQITTGNDLMISCRSNVSYELGMCDGLIQYHIAALGNVISYPTMQRESCVPTDTSLSKVRDAILQYGDRNLNAQRDPIKSFVSSAIKAAFPCPEEPRGSRQRTR
jgi:hypothetical protein